MVDTGVTLSLGKEPSLFPGLIVGKFSNRWRITFPKSCHLSVKNVTEFRFRENQLNPLGFTLLLEILLKAKCVLISNLRVGENTIL